MIKCSFYHRINQLGFDFLKTEREFERLKPLKHLKNECVILERVMLKAQVRTL